MKEPYRKGVTLKNELSTALTIIGFTLTGAVPNDFAISTSTGGTCLAAKSSLPDQSGFQTAGYRLAHRDAEGEARTMEARASSSAGSATARRR